MVGIELFKKRTYAYIIDFFVVSAFMWIISYVLYLFANFYNVFEIYHYFIFVLPIIQLIYFTVLEKKNHATIGKRLVYIEVESLHGDLSYSQTFIRSISKVFWVIIILDIIIGLIVKKNDRYLDYMSRTHVVEEDNPDNKALNPTQEEDKETHEEDQEISDD